MELINTETLEIDADWGKKGLSPAVGEELVSTLHAGHQSSANHCQHMTQDM